MAFPITTGTTTGFFGGSGSQTITLPSANSGDLLVVVYTVRTNAQDVTWPAGWNAVYPFFTAAAGGDPSGGCMYKVSDGTEGGSVGVTAGATLRVAWVSYTIQKDTWDTGNPPTGTQPTVDTNSNLQPPTLNPGVAKDYKWFVMGTVRGGGSMSAYPSGYTNTQLSAGDGSTNYSQTGTAEIDENASSKAPGTFTVSPTGNNIVAAFYVTPGSATSTTNFFQMM